MADRKLKIKVSEDRCGNILLDPVNCRILRRCKRAIVANHREGSPDMHNEFQRDETVAWLNRGSCAFFNQGSQAACEVIEDLRLTGSEKRDLEHGWTVTKLVDLDLWDHLFHFANGMPGEF
jgi:hypothetical protein